MPVRDQEAFLPPGRARVRFLSNRGANGIDGLVSTAAGLAAGGARRGRCSATWPSSTTSGGWPSRPRTPNLRLLVLDNGGGGIFHFLPQAGRCWSTTSSRRCSARRPARTWSEPGRSRPRRRRALDPASLVALAGDCPVILVRTDRRENLELHRRLGRTPQRSPGPALRPSSSGSSASSLISVSASSAPGRSRRRSRSPRRGGRAVAEQRRAQGDAELAVLGRVHPADGARVPAAVQLLELVDQRDAGLARLAADGGRRVQQPGQLDRRARSRRAGPGSGSRGAGCWRP